MLGIKGPWWTGLELLTILTSHFSLSYSLYVSHADFEFASVGSLPLAFHLEILSLPSLHIHIPVSKCNYLHKAFPDCSCLPSFYFSVQSFLIRRARCFCHYYLGEWLKERLIHCLLESLQAGKGLQGSWEFLQSVWKVFSWVWKHMWAHRASKSLVSHLKEASHHVVLLNEPLHSHLYVIKTP